MGLLNRMLSGDEETEKQAALYKLSDKILAIECSLADRYPWLSEQQELLIEYHLDKASYVALEAIFDNEPANKDYSKRIEEAKELKDLLAQQLDILEWKMERAKRIERARETDKRIQKEWDKPSRIDLSNLFKNSEED